MKFGIGQPLKRLEDNRLLTGNAIYTDDISLNNQAYMYVLRSPHANAKILNIDISEALKEKDLIKIISSDDIQSLSLKEMRTTFLVKNKNGEPMTDTPRHILAKKNVKTIIGPHANIDKIQFSKGLPKTRSGKIMRRILRKISENNINDLGDISTLADPSVVQSLIDGKK